ncbi:MAG TPA: tRNA (adenosine(37)-N6)-threonylcarbamoyltransferase complex dimerization subunit type 1 TsaB [Solirubrobacter sp.]|nr:tRNA (adenosine(37)-N6)-threonylcarbamoyltransferase complex dimerization subunit type 1 TsaB [Solirubrobacter sp.]
MIVGLDTSTNAASVAVIGARGEFERHDDPDRPRHAQTLQPMLEQVLADAGGTWEDVERICVGVGPGGFTGLRLGIATARALAQALDVPLVGVSSLEALALGVEDDHHDVLAVIDARRGEVFAALYREGRCIIEPVAIRPGELAARLSRRREAILGVGDGAVRFREQLERAGVAVPADGSHAHRVSALMICRLGRTREPVDRDALLPDYRREPDAQEPPGGAAAPPDPPA